MSSLLNRVLQQAAVTFNAANHRELQKNLGALKILVDTMRYSDLNLDPKLVAKTPVPNPDKAPCTYVGIYEDSNFSMSVFIISENYTMPLHDHPNMHGMLKCISTGKLRVQSYSMDSAKEEPLNVLERLYALNPDERPPVKKYVHCRREPIVEIVETSPVASLTPDERNVHQITAVGGPVAFFDILSPPYDTFIQARPHLKRKCTFFKVAEEVADSDHVVLEKIAQPRHYYCDNVLFN